MGKIQEFYMKIHQNSERCTLEDGMLKVSGEVVIVVKKDIVVKRLDVHLTGESAVVYSENTGKRIRVYESTDSLIDQKVDVLKSFRKKRSSTDVKILAGENLYPFEFEVHEVGLPSSFEVQESLAGRIIYRLKARMIRGTFSIDKTLKIPIKVFNPPVLTEGDMQSAELDEDQDSIVLHASINKSAIALLTDDTIKVDMTVDNYTDRSLYPEIYLEETAFLQTPKSSTARDRKLKLNGRQRNIMPNVRKCPVSFAVGPLDDSISGTITSTSNLRVSYDIVIKLEGSRVKVSFPVVIGGSGRPTDPLQGSTFLTGAPGEIAGRTDDLPLSEHPLQGKNSKYLAY